MKDLMLDVCLQTRACRATLANAQSSLETFPYCPCQTEAARAPFYVQNAVEYNAANNEWCFTVRSDNPTTGSCRNMDMQKFELDVSKSMVSCGVRTLQACLCWEGSGPPDRVLGVCAACVMARASCAHH